MTAIELRQKLNHEYGILKPWPDHLDVDADTYANACQAVFDSVDNSDGEFVKEEKVALGTNNGIMFKNVELILIPDKSTETTYLNLNDLKVLYGLLDHQYVSYENVEAIQLIRKIRGLIGDEL